MNGAAQALADAAKVEAAKRLSGGIERARFAPQKQADPMRQARIALVVVAALAGISGMGYAQTAAPPAPPEDAQKPAEDAAPADAQVGRISCPPGIGCVTRQKLPRFVSLKGAEARARRGPGSDHRVDWVYERPGLPMRVTAEYENWRRVEDFEGAGGWMHYALLSSSRTAIVTAEMADLRGSADAGASVTARAQNGAILRISECAPDWCYVSRDGYRGWVSKTQIWGTEPGETFD